MLLDTDRDKNIDCLFSVRHILLSDTEFKGGFPDPSGSNTPLLGVLGVLNVLNALNVLNVLH